MGIKRIGRRLAGLALMLALLVSCGQREEIPPPAPSEPSAPAAASPAEPAAQAETPAPAPAGSLTVCGDPETLTEQLTTVPLLTLDRRGLPVEQGIEGETRGGYTYWGPADVTVGEDAVEITLRRDLFTPEGEPVTAGDLVDLLYDRLSPDRSIPEDLKIEGLAEYRQSAVFLYEALIEAGPDNTDFSRWDQETQTGFWEALPAAEAGFVQSIRDFCVDGGFNDSGDSDRDIADSWGYLIGEDEDFFGAMLAAHDGDYLALSDEEHAGRSLWSFLDPGYCTHLAEGTISGIRETDDYAVTIETTGYDGALLPLLAELRLPCGPFRAAESMEDAVTLVPNAGYYRGVPRLASLILVSEGEADLRQVEGGGPDSVYFPGYGGVSISARRVCVKNAPGSEASIALRRAIALVLTACREEALGEAMEPLGYPISRASWACPEGEMVDITMEEALEQAAALLETSGRPEEPLRAAAAADSPLAGLLKAAAEALEALDIELDVTLCDTPEEVWELAAAGETDLWALAWQTGPEPDMTSLYRSGGSANLTGIADKNLDSILSEARGVRDPEIRKGLYKNALDKIAAWAVEVPVYQRRVRWEYSEGVDPETLPPETTAFYGWWCEAEKLGAKPE